MARKIEVVEYNPQWAKEFKEESKKSKQFWARTVLEFIISEVPQ